MKTASVRYRTLAVHLADAIHTKFFLVRLFALSIAALLLWPYAVKDSAHGNAIPADEFFQRPVNNSEAVKFFPQEINPRGITLIAVSLDNVAVQNDEPNSSHYIY